MDATLVLLFFLYGIVMLYDTFAFADIWRKRGYRTRDVFAWLPTTFGKETLKSFSIGGRALFALAIGILSWGAHPSTLIFGTLFILFLSFTSNLCTCTRTQLHLPKEYDTALFLFAFVSLFFEIILFASCCIFFPTIQQQETITFVILTLSASRFLFASITGIVLSPFISHRA
jgi:hypothetical protein